MAATKIILLETIFKFKVDGLFYEVHWKEHENSKKHFKAYRVWVIRNDEVICSWKSTAFINKTNSKNLLLNSLKRYTPPTKLNT